MNLTFYLALAAFSVIMVAQAQNTQLELRQQFNASDFVYDLDNAKVVLRNGGGSLTPLTVSQMPSLAGQRIAYALLRVFINLLLLNLSL